MIRSIDANVLQISEGKALKNENLILKINIIMKTKISNYRNCFALAYVLLVAVLFAGCEIKERKYETVKTELIIVKKYAEIESRNNMGAFDTYHYFLYNNGELEDVELKEYITYEIGDTIVKTESVRVE